MARFKRVNVDGSRSKTGGQVWKIKAYILLRSSEGSERKGNGDFLRMASSSPSSSETYVDGHREEIGVEDTLVAAERIAFAGIGTTPRTLCFIDLGICTEFGDTSFGSVRFQDSWGVSNGVEKRVF